MKAARPGAPGARPLVPPPVGSGAVGRADGMARVAPPAGAAAGGLTAGPRCGRAAGVSLDSGSSSENQRDGWEGRRDGCGGRCGTTGEGGAGRLRREVRGDWGGR
ncbi:hypothetical protein GCM10023329_57820 [Streptomyces sanyensis]|uniref:Uncharacterized protein n=1 Tax=Streptomyces sanyensis TaxID=568869 RepID=A0ABP9BQL6_9ACTN